MFWNHRATRITVGLLLVGTAAIVLLPSLTGYTSLDGTLNARFTVIAAPIEGTIVYTPPKAGTPLNEGQSVIAIQNERVNKAVLAALSAEETSARDRVTALRREREELALLRDSLADRLQAYQRATVTYLHQELTVLRKRIEMAQAHEVASQAEFTRRYTLGTSGIVAASSVEQARAAGVNSTGQIEIARVAAEQLEHKLIAVRAGIFVGDGQNDVPYSRQRQDEVTVRISDIDTRIADSETRAVQIAKQMAEENERVRSLSAASLTAPFSGVVWRNNVVDGSNVVVGNELVRLLDCRDLFVDILVPELDYDEIFPGRQAEVRLLGRGDVVKGWVLSVRGNAAVVEEVTLAATPPKSHGRDAKIRVAVEHSALNGDFSNFCQVGRTAQVRFEKRTLPWRRWMKSAWFSIS
jgi:multidrug resistance efflux pump